MFRQFAATSQFYLYGRKHFTKTGYEKHQKQYEQPDTLESSDLNLTGRVFIVTGANSGIGKEITRFLATKGASVFMICRNLERAEAARQELLKTAHARSELTVLQGDMGLEEDVRRCWSEFSAAQKSPVRLDGLVCNAGALYNDKTVTSEGVEATFAGHLLFGSYLLGSLALPTLEATEDSRLIFVSSGGMYNVPFPAWDVATATTKDPKFKYDGQLAYAYAKRAQILLAERWGEQFPKVKVVSCHPGWTSTPGVDSAYGDQQKYLEPLRTPWEGAEGICWLCAALASKLESGAFYLDRQPQVKHMAGPFFTEGSYTKNSTQEVDALMKNLDDWANGRKPKDSREVHEIAAAASEARKGQLKAMETPIDIHRYMGRWYVAANIPTFADKDTTNNIEDYVYDEANRTVNITFSYADKEQKKTSQILQKAVVENDANTKWALSPKFGIYLPLKLPYIIVACDDDYSTSIIGYPDRSYLWIMTRVPNPSEEVVEELIKKAERMGYDARQIIRVPQVWPKQGAGDAAPSSADEHLV
eukprot:CAMPEP_0206544496 /NCGR_PEP_ID=MMETSP0325_2-20121206/11563_1 /ASSEMBLY_ACC=CAM_ASM_000347 /TAXON_ID=2866 /ORGANISM="Crypthecodinium cohnii, Strain Seligo" /LENGTH=531 /DNA_ID=CAMNT_0054043277 /DNA_START=52 /DNA_END=1644 /DNA_ORIENTATION=-